MVLWDRADGSTSLITGLPFVDVKIGNYVAVTDNKSQFTMSGLEKGEYPILHLSHIIIPIVHNQLAMEQCTHIIPSIIRAII